MMRRSGNMSEQEKFTFFLSGPFSQWYKSSFRVKGIRYNTAEQFMMSMKAEHFGDTDTQAKIMNAPDPWTQKSLGRKVTPFDIDSWNAVSRDYVYEANRAKFSQNADLYLKLMETKGTTFVEASPNDKIWGIGYGPNTAASIDPELYGENILGKCLEKIRAELCKINLKSTT